MFWKLFWPTVRKNCCSHWDFFQIIAILCLSVSKNNFGNKIPFLNAIRTNNLDVKIYRIIYKKYLFCFFILGAKTTAKKRGKFANSSGLFQHGIHTHQTCSKNSQISSHFEWTYKSKLCILFYSYWKVFQSYFVLILFILFSFWMRSHCLDLNLNDQKM